MKRTILPVSAAIILAAVTFSSVASSSTASRKVEVAVARKALVTISDFPSGWTTTPYSNSGGTPGLKQIAACIGVSESVVDYNAPEADSPNFNDTATNVQVQDSVDVFPSVKIATQQFDLFALPKSLGCVIKAFNTPAIKAPLARSIGKGATVGTVTASDLPKPARTNESDGFVIHIPTKYKGISLSVNIETITIMSKSKTEGAQLTFTYSNISTLPASLVSHLEAITVERLG